MGRRQPALVSSLRRVGGSAFPIELELRTWFMLSLMFSSALIAMPGKGKPFCPGDPRAGRPKGSVNKATRDVRAAIAQFADANVDKLQGWLDRVAARDPAKAVEIYLRLLEYHVPRLARTELSGEVGMRGKLVISD